MFKTVLYLALFVTLFSHIDASATEIRWTAGNTLGADWNTPTNWDLLRVPIASDTVIGGYGDWINITQGYTAECLYLKILSTLNISVGGKLWVKDGQFDALGNINNYGSIKVTNSPEEGMIFATQASDVEFNNHGEIYIDQSVKEGFFIKFDQVFTNHPGGFIEVTNATLESFRVEGIFNNSGLIHLGTGGNGVALSMHMSPSTSTAQSEINNLSCGKMVVLEKFEIIDGIFINDGFFRQNYNGLNDLQAVASTVENYGIVEDIQGSFDYSDFDVQTIWLRPVENLEVNTGEPTLPMINNFPSSTTYSDVYTDHSLNTHAGTYDGLTNTWIPNANANGLSTFFLEITQTGGSCLDTVRFDLVNPVIETTYWIGGNGNWQNGSKWSTGIVPTASDFAGIYGSTDEVFIPIGTDAFAKYLDISGQLTIQILSSLTVNAAGSLRGIYVLKGTLINNGILNVGNCIIGVDLLNSTLTNNNTINCTNSNICVEIDQNAGLLGFLTNNGTISNNNGDLINGDESEILNTGTMSGMLPIVYGIFGENFTNEGIIKIEGDGSNGTGFFGTITNGATGSIVVEKLEIGLEIEGGNQGTILAENCDTGIEFSDNFENFSGGEMNVTDSNTGVLLKDGNVENKAGATISILRSGNYGLRIPEPFVSAGYLINDGLIEIDTTAGIGILSSNDITNQGTGIINVSNSGGDGFHSLTEHAILLNKNQGMINIINSGGNSLTQEGGTFTNEGNGQIIFNNSGLLDVLIKNYESSPFIYHSTFTNNSLIGVK